MSDLAQIINLNKTISKLEILWVNVSHSDCLLFADMLTVNTTVKEVKIMLFREGLDQSVRSTAVPEAVKAQLHTGSFITGVNK